MVFTCKIFFAGWGMDLIIYVVIHTYLDYGKQQLEYEK